MTATVIVLWFVAPALINYRMACSKDRDAWGWVALALLGGWISVAVLAALRPIRGECPDCLLPVRYGARKCPHCGTVYDYGDETAVA